jgi:hypothetical protein
MVLRPPSTDGLPKARLGCGFGLDLSHGLNFLNTNPPTQNQTVHFYGNKKKIKTVNQLALKTKTMFEIID